MADELERALLLRDLELMGQPRNPNAVQPGRAGLLDLGVGLPERLSLLNQIFNPVEAIGQSMNAGGRMMSPNMGVMDRLAALGDMASGIAGVVAPVAAASRAGTPAATALMEGLLGASPTQQAAADMARGFVTDESGALRLYHGSPHDFDRFSMGKIGTGEGAQAYGHGLYFAENEGIGQNYKKALAYKNLKNSFLDALPPDASFDEVEDLIKEGHFTSDQSRFLTELNNNDWLGFDYPSQAISEALRGKLGAYDITPELEDASNRLGRMYEVEVNANPEDFIDFDAPLSDQSEKVRKVLGEGSVAAADRLQKGYRNPMYGGDLIGVDRATPEEVSQGLLNRGIAGIRYLDAGSRGMGYEIKLSNRGKPYETEPIMAGSRKDAERIASEYRENGFGADIQQAGSRNYVIFDENLINIVRKYGIAGAAAMLGVSAFDVEQAMAQGQQQPQGLLSTGVQ